MKGSGWAWFAFLSFISLFALIYIVFNQITYVEIGPSQKETLTNSTNIDVMNYALTIWHFLPLIVLIAFGFWAYMQSQKEA